MTVSGAYIAKTVISVALLASLSFPLEAAGLGVGAGASVGGSGGANAGAGASVGGNNGANAGLGASVGGADGSTAGVGANVGGTSAVGVGVGVGVGVINPTTPADPTTPAASAQSLPGTVAQMSASQLARMKKRCVDVLNGSGSYDGDLRELCLMISRR